MNTVGFRNIEELRNSNGLLKGFNQVVVITDDLLGGTFKTIRKGDAVLDGGVYIQGDSRYDLKRVYDNINVDVVWFGSDLASFFNYCASKDEYAYMSKGVFDLGGASIALPANLKIKSGAGYFTNGTLVGNNTYFELNQHHKLFDPSIVFEGEWKGITVTPQNFGAITNKDNTVFENDCSAAIQAAIDSPFNVHFPAGYYYVSNTSYFTKAKSVTLERGILPGDNAGPGYSNPFHPDETRIYSDQDIDYFRVQAERVYLIGGLLDCTNIEYHTKGGIAFDLNYRMWGCEVDTVVLGNPQTLSINGNGTLGIYADNTNITQEGGFMCMCKIKAYMRYVNYGFWAQPPTGHSIYTWLTSINTDLIVDGFKRHTIFDIGNKNEIKGIGQARSTRSDEEKDEYSVVAENSTIDFFCWDVASYRGTQAPWGPSNPLILDKGMCRWEGQTDRSTTEYASGLAFTPMPIVNPPESLFSKTNYGASQPIISLLHNQLASADKRFTTSIKAYSGAGFDFDSNLTETTLPENENIVIERPENLFKTKPGDPCAFTFTDLADIDNDFVEIVIDFGEFTSFSTFYLSFRPEGGTADTRKIKRVQILSGSPPRNYYGLNRPFLKNGIGGNKIIIRIIGGHLVDEPVRVLDVFAARVVPNISPFITTDGGERIYGDLTLDGSIIADKLAVGNSTAGTTAGTITNKIEIFDKSGVSLGFVPVYDSIT